MPVENELKYVLAPDFNPSALKGWARHAIRQAYLDDGPRIRQIDNDYLFTYKKWVPESGELVEIETALSADDFNLLWPLCRESLSKTRFVKEVGDAEWVVDFLMDDDKDVYFVIAEVEMPRYATAPEAIPAEIRSHILHAVDAGDNSFTNKKLSDRNYAARLYRQISDNQ